MDFLTVILIAFGLLVFLASIFTVSSVNTVVYGVQFYMRKYTRTPIVDHKFKFDPSKYSDL